VAGTDEFALAGVAARMSEAAQGLLGSLDQGQRELMKFAVDAVDERRRWYYGPTEQGGLPLVAMTAAQQRLAHRLMAAGLSTGGYALASMIMGYENILDADEDWNLNGGSFEFYPGRESHARGRDPQMYFFSVFGDPGSSRWGWRVGGHHLSLNFFVIDGLVAASRPMFMGVNPARTPLVDGSLALLSPEEQLAREVFVSLEAEQASLAHISLVPPFDLTQSGRPAVAPDTLWDPGLLWGFTPSEHTNKNLLIPRLEARADEYMKEKGWDAMAADAIRYTAKPKGIPGSLLSPPQRRLLMSVISHFARRLSDRLAEQEIASQTDAILDETYFAWAGPAEPGKPCYYRIHGPDLLIEFNNVQRNANHAHSLWRSIANDFGQ
jgi:hypothetical protein